MSITETILAQLGGNKFTAMTGAHSFVGNLDDNSLRFKLPRGAKNGANLVTVRLNTQLDLYFVTFQKYRNLNVDTVSEHEMVNVSELRRLFTRETGMDVTL